jgi:hypothetical protein
VLKKRNKLKKGGLRITLLINPKRVAPFKSTTFLKSLPRFNWMHRFLIVLHKVGGGRFHIYPIQIIKNKFFGEQRV